MVQANFAEKLQIRNHLGNLAAPRCQNKVFKGVRAMQSAKIFPVSDFKMPKGPGDLNRFADNLVARLRDVQRALAECQPEYEPEKRTGS